MSTSRSILTALRHVNSSNTDILTEDNSRDTASNVRLSPHLEDNGLLPDLDPMKTDKTISVAIGNLSANFEIPLTQEPYSLASGVLSNKTQRVETNPVDISAKVAEILLRDEDDDHMHKIIGIVIPFSCVIVVAALLLLTWRLCNKYSRNNHKGLRKIALFCDSCMTTRHVFQETSNQRQNTSITLESSSYSFRSVLSPTSSSTRISSSLDNYSQTRSAQSPNKSNMPGRSSNSLSPAGLRVKYISSDRKPRPHYPYTLQNSGQCSSGHRKSRPIYHPCTLQNSGQCSSGHRKPRPIYHPCTLHNSGPCSNGHQRLTGDTSYGRLSSHISPGKSRQTVGLGPSSRPGRSSTSVHALLQPESIVE